ncbi:class I SAM-dependent methyltransferase [Deinococcus cellulosilyticus]|uniref:Ribosomal RNA small subunit methyltransferase J n=1 Tax=Deinococcus cellulosilyticus (strain DSM 18568 / NBRC 106333 / KACC 11606 / 5516J-15) TaxID=1223518 RepID=A0A511N4Y0_DEIC1|nr:class I SAM-dependent methyltransferase [Deinococcus cellulosilyticus]GEM47902.1 ribosomal RNA small subunit methyltransferase J [Deinococcus cellulosilyticus NBRC 106333 = KACC 11606]
MIGVTFEEGLQEQAATLALQLDLSLVDDPARFQYGLRLTPQGLDIVDLHKKQRPIRVDFHQLNEDRSGGDLIKAVNTRMHKTVLDATGGLGRDAFMLAKAGCQVILMEKNPIIHALLQDGLARAQDLEAVQRMTLIHADSLIAMPDYTPEVIYLDPMYPARKKDALPKLEMQVFHALLGAEQNEQELLQVALNQARKRVVVKRPIHAPVILPTGLQFKGKTTRFDVYLK